MKVKLSEVMKEVLNKRYFKNNDHFTSERKKELINDLSAMCEESIVSTHTPFYFDS